MDLSEKAFQVLDTLDREEISNQRQIAEHTGVSLGQVNYIIKSFLKKGLVKIGNFRKNPNKVGYMYLLTPKGIEAKSKVAVKFVVAKLNEYNELRSRITESLFSINKADHTRIIFIGPIIVKDFLLSIIKESELNLNLVAHFHTWDGLKDKNPDSYDAVLMLDDNAMGIKKLAATTGIPRDKFYLLW
ncbi:MarR family EPS-associated transcriptional regulator [Thermodesulfobacteriota bacterium]